MRHMRYVIHLKLAMTALNVIAHVFHD